MISVEFRINHEKEALTIFIFSRQLLKLERVVQWDADITHIPGRSNDTPLSNDVVYEIDL